MKKINKKNLIILLILLTLVVLGIVLIVKLFLKSNNTIVYSYNGWLYVDNADNKLGRGTLDTVLFSSKRDTFLYKIENDLYLYKDKENKKVTNSVRNYYFTEDDKYVISLNIKNKLEFYKDDELTTISENIDQYINVYKDNVYYVVDSNLHKYNLNKKEDSTLLENVYNCYIVKDKLMYINSDMSLVYYSLKNEKDIDTFKSVSSYLCDDNCDKFAFINSKNNLYYYDGKDASKIDEKINMIVDVNEFVFYTKIVDKNLKYFVSNGDDTKKLDSLLISKCYFQDKNAYCTTNDGKLYLIDSKLNEKEIAKNVFSEMILYKDNYYYVSTDKESSTLYKIVDDEGEKIDDNVDSISIKTNDNKLYYIKYNEGTKELYSYDKKSNLLRSNISNYYLINKDVYILKEYNESELSGKLYLYNKKEDKLLIENVTDVI